MIKPDILTNINKKYNTLTNAERKVADYIFLNKSEVQYMTITNFAFEADVAEATIFRFCRTLGFSGYNDFKLSLAKSMVHSVVDDDIYAIYGEVKPDDSLSDMFIKLYNSQIDALTQTMQILVEEDIVKAVDMLCNAGKVYCMGQGGSLILAMEAWGRFISASNKFYCVQDNHQQAVTASLLDKDDCIIFFSYSGNTKDIMDILPSAYEKGIKIILVTGFPQSDAATYVDIVLQCGYREGPLQMGSIATKVAQLYLIDILYNEFCRRDMDTTIYNREITSQAIAKKML